MEKHRLNNLRHFLRKRWIPLTFLTAAAAAVTAGTVIALRILVPQWAFDRSLFERNETEEPGELSFPEWQGMALSELISAATASPTGQPVETAADYDFTKKRINILALGLDSSEERVAAGMNFRSDTLILISVNFTDKTVDMLSIPRDTYTSVYNKDDRNKINSAFSFGGGVSGDGFEYAINTVSAFLGGIPIDYYVGFDMEAVKKIINIMGGVWYDVDISFTMCGRPMETGYQLLNGQQVLDYCRWRYTTGGDIGRIDRQQRMLTAIFEQMKTTRQIRNLPDIYTAVSEGLYTNLQPVQIAALAGFMMELGIGNISRHTVQGQSVMINDVSYYVIYQEKKKELVKDIFGVTITYDPEEDVDYILMELERNKKALAAAISNCNALTEAVGAMLASADAQYLTAGEKTALQAGIARCEDAVDMQTKDLIESETESLKASYNQSKSLISSRKSVKTEATKTLASVGAGITRYESFIRPDDRTRIDAAASALSTAVDEGDYDVMESLIRELEEISRPVFEESGRLQTAREALEPTVVIVEDMTLNHTALYFEDRTELKSLAAGARALLAGYDAAAVTAMNEALAEKTFECLDDIYGALRTELSAWAAGEQEQCRPLVEAADSSRAEKLLPETADGVEALYHEMKTLRPAWKMDLHEPEETPQ